MKGKRKIHLYKTQPYDKVPFTNRKFKKTERQKKTIIERFNFTTIADRLRRVSWTYFSHKTWMFRDLTFPLPATVVQ